MQHREAHKLLRHKLQCRHNTKRNELQPNQASTSCHHALVRGRLHCFHQQGKSGAQLPRLQIQMEANALGGK